AAVAISPAVAEAARRAAPGIPVEVIVNRFALEERGSREDRARVRSELGLSEEHKVALYTGSFVALQALDLLVEAIPLVARRVRDPDRPRSGELRAGDRSGPHGPGLRRARGRRSEDDPREPVSPRPARGVLPPDPRARRGGCARSMTRVRRLHWKSLAAGCL